MGDGGFKSKPLYSQGFLRLRDFYLGIGVIQDWKINKPSQTAVVFQDGIQHNSIFVEQLRKMGKSGVYIFSLPDYYEQYWEKIPVTSVDRSWAFRSIGSNFLNDRMGIRLKRIADFIFGIARLVVTSPILLATALIIRFTSPGDVIYKQTRVGLNEKNFTVYKFRSMVNDAEKDGPQWSSADDTRITGFGQFLRRSRIDELPQLWNLIIGNMSLIGPRPERPEFVENLKNEIS